TGHLLEELFRDQLGADLLLRLILGKPLLLERLLVALLAAAVELLLQLLDALVHLVVRDLDSHSFGLLRELRPLDQERDRLALELLVLGAAGLREGALLREVA